MSPWIIGIPAELLIKVPIKDKTKIAVALTPKELIISDLINFSVSVLYNKKANTINRPKKITE